jgi:hypothetical protein
MRRDSMPMRDSIFAETGAQVLMYNGKVFAGADRNTGSNAVFYPAAHHNRRRRHWALGCRAIVPA